MSRYDEDRNKYHKKRIQNRSAATSQAQGIEPSFAAIQSDDLQSEFQAIKYSVSRRKLPKDLKFTGQNRGIHSQAKDMVRVLTASGRYVETCLKLASSIQAGRDNPEFENQEDVDDLLVALVAHMRYLQEEHCLLSIGGNYGSRTQQIFHAIHNNPCYTLTVIEELRASTTLAAIPQEQSSDT